MLWPQRGTGVRLGGAELRSNAGRYALIAALRRLLVCGRILPLRPCRTVDLGIAAAGYACAIGLRRATSAPRSCTSTASRSSKAATAISRGRPSNRSSPAIRQRRSANDARRQLGELYRARSFDHASMPTATVNASRAWPLRRPPPPARSRRRRSVGQSRACPSCNPRAARSGSRSCAATRPSNRSFASRRAIGYSSVRAAPSSAAAPARRSLRRRNG